MARLKGKKLWQTVGSVALAIVTFVGVAVGISALSKKADEDMKVINPKYEIGGLSATGEYEETEGSIYTKESFKCQGLTIKPEFDSAVKYQVFFYDELGEFVSATDVMEKAYNEAIPELAIEARIEITPDWAFLDVTDKDEQIVKWYEVDKYAKQIEVSVLKEQEIEYEVGEFERVSLENECLFDDYVYYSADGLRIHSDGNTYCTYGYTAVNSCKFYIESELVPFQYVVITSAGAVRYQKSNGTYVGGEENQFDLSEGDRVMISFNRQADPNNVFLYVAQKTRI